MARLHPLRVSLGYSSSEKTALGRHANRAVLRDVNTKFLTTIPVAEAEALIDSGAAERISPRNERPMRIRLLLSIIQPGLNSPTAGCTAPAAITASDMEACVGITRGELGAPANRGRVKAAQAKIAAWRFVGGDRAVRAR